MPPSDPSEHAAVSVVVPAYNRLDLLRPVLEGFVREARTTAFELILVDDGSEPPAAPLLAEIGAPPAFRCVRHATNLGRGAAVNTGVAAARGAIVVVCDSDIVPQPGFLAGHLEFHRQNPSELVTHLGALEWGIDAGLYGELMGARSNPRMIGRRGEVDWTLGYTDQWSFKRALFTRHGVAFDTGYKAWGFEDLDLARRLAALGSTCVQSGASLGLHLKPATLEASLRNFAASVPNLLRLCRKFPDAAEPSRWLATRFATEAALKAAEDFLAEAWRRCLALDAQARRRTGRSLAHDPIAPALALALSDAVFAIGTARGWMRQDPSAAEAHAGGLPQQDDVQPIVDLSRLAAVVYAAGARVSDEIASYEHLERSARALLAGAGAARATAQGFWGSLEDRLPEVASGLEPAATAERADARVDGPELSVVVPTYGRPERIQALLEHLDAQTLDPRRFEVVVVDDGTPVPIAIDPAAHAYPVRLLRQANAGPGAARNLAFEHCRAALVLILNDDAVPAPDLLAGHVAAHAHVGERVAILGTFHFTARSLSNPFVQVLQATNLLFDFPGLRNFGLHDWKFFWTCNISLPLALLREVGGFDAELFKEAIVEDSELGYRLHQRGVQVLYREDLRCEHDHVVDSAAYFRRMQRLGANVARMYRKHGDPKVIWCPDAWRVDQEYLRSMQATCEALHASYEEFLQRLARFETEYAGRSVPPELIAQLYELCCRLGRVPMARGMLQELEGHDPVRVLQSGPRPGRLTSVIVVSHQARDQTRRCLDSLRHAQEVAHPIEILFVDNGSTDGTPEYLEAQADVRLIRNAENLGAPRARNQAIPHARGDCIVFLDNDAMVSPGWLGRLLHHADVDGRSGAISCVADRARAEQHVEAPAAAGTAALEAFASRLAREQHRQSRPTILLSSFLLLVRREVLEAIGGFDERFTPWGFEDDDFALRAHLAGFRNRIARDVFVHHEAYGGPKAARHQELLDINWKRFVQKWGLNPAAPYGRYDGLAAVEARAWSRKELFVALPELLESVGAALPRRPAFPAAVAAVEERAR